MEKWIQRISRTIAMAAALWCLGAGFVIPTRPIAWQAMNPGSPTITIVYRAFLYDSNYGVWPLMIPIVLSGLAAWAAWDRRRLTFCLLTILFAAFVVIKGFSIGASYLPAAALLLIDIVPVAFLRRA